MSIVISRTDGKNETQGILFVLRGHHLLYQCKCIELPDNGNRRDVSCIPKGVYDIVKFNSPTRGMCIYVLNVPGRDNILIHKGNYVSERRVDSKGCILPGTYFTDINNDGLIDIAESSVAMNNILTLLPDKDKLIIC